MVAQPFELERFVAAQEPVFETALAELTVSKKRSHWMWFIFPQLRGLGSSPAAHFYGIGSLEEARAYLAHPVLGPRLTRCTQATLTSGAHTLRKLFSSPDDLKFCSCMTLFALVSHEAENLYERSLEHWCEGQPDAQTERLLSLRR